MQYAELAAEVRSGRGRIPVADYKVGNYISGVGADEHFDSGPMKRSCYSFCMCPGGQVISLVYLTCFYWHLCFDFSLAHCI